MAGKGSAPGERRGGRKAGTPNKSTDPKLKALIQQGVSPLDYLLQVMRTDENPEMRFKAANAAAPYVHAKLASVEVGNKEGEVFRVGLLTDDGGLL